MFVNELQGLRIECTDSGLIPVTANATLINQICEIPGATAGQDFVRGSDYIRAQGFDFAHRWRNIGILIAIAVAYLVIGAVGSEVMSFAPQGGSYLSYVKNGSRDGSDKGGLDVPGAENSAPVSSASSPSVVGPFDAAAPGSGELIMSWKDFTVDIGEKRILKGITGYTRRGAMTALCGASGAGKTTLLSQLSQTATVGTPGGDVWFRSRKPGPEFRKTTGTWRQPPPPPFHTHIQNPEPSPQGDMPVCGLLTRV